MKYRIVIEWLVPPSKIPGKFKYEDLKAALKVAKRIQDEDYPRVLTFVEDENRVRYDHEVEK